MKFQLANLEKIVQKGLFLLLLLLVFGCTTTTDKPAEVLEGLLNDTDEQIFVGDTMEANYDPNVIMKRAESYFEKERYPEAIVEYKHFLDLHRGHVLAPYAQFKIGVTHFKRFKTVDRDPEPVEESIVAFEKLLSEYPNNRYEAEARNKIKVGHERLAAHHMLVGKFYYRKESYLAAAGRYEKVITSFPELPAAGDAKYLLAQTYQDLGAQQWAADWMVDFVQHHPENENYEDGMKMLVELQEDHPDVMIALNPTNAEEAPGLTEEQTGLGVLSAGYQNGNLPDFSSSVSTPSHPVPIQVAHAEAPSSITADNDSQSSAAVHTEDALCSLGSWCESTPAPHSPQTSSAPAPASASPSNTTVCRLGEWC